MWKFLLLLLISFDGLDAIKTFNPKGHNYCLRNFTHCNGAEHTACWCKIIPPREILETDLKEFRQIMVDAHNENRNAIANGEIKGFPSASNMQVVSYDLEIEYIARCHAGKFNGSHDVCRSISKDIFAGQNLVGAPDTFTNLAAYADWIKTHWFEEYKYAELSDIHNFTRSKDKYHNFYIAHFTTFAWANVDLIGCSRAIIKDFGQWRHSLLCNYICTKGQPPNMVFVPVYKEGKPASACPEGMRPSKKYPALCGAPLPKTGHKALICMTVLIKIFIYYT